MGKKQTTQNLFYKMNEMGGDELPRTISKQRNEKVLDLEALEAYLAKGGV